MKQPRMIELMPSEDVLAALKRCGGFYACPTDESGKRLGPLVGYAGEYEPDKHFVGDVYANFAKMERFPVLYEHYAALLRRELSEHINDIDVFCGAPFGGLSLANLLALVCSRRYAFTEKVVTKPAQGGEREKSKLVFKRHEIHAGDNVVISEDVCNNFSTTEEMIKLIKESGGNVIAIACMLNRSLTVRETYHSKALDRDIPVFALSNKQIEEFRQDDDRVAADIEAGNVVWKPKFEWDRLETAMQKTEN